MSDPNLNDAVEPEAGAFESAKDELDIVEAADSVDPDQAEAADLAAGEPAEQAAVNVEAEESDEDAAEAVESDEDEAAEDEADDETADEEEAEPPPPSTPSPPCATSSARSPASGTSSTRTPVTRSA